DVHGRGGDRRGDRLPAERCRAQGERPAALAPRMSAPRRGFASDNYAGVLPEVLEAVAAANAGHAPAYGADDWTARARESFREHFGHEARAFPVFNGTGANVLALRAAMRPYEAVVCADTAHL